MKKPTARLSLMVIVLMVGPTFAQAKDINDYDKLAPFTAVKWDGWTPQVRVKARWYELISLNDIPASDIVTFCRTKYPGKAKKRFVEDLVAVLDGLGSPPTTEVSLVLRDLDRQEVISMTQVTMNSKNRKAAYEYSRARTERDQLLSVSQIRGDLTALQTGLESQFSYLRTNGVDYRRTITQVSEGLSSALSTSVLASEVRKIVALFIDGHAGVSDVSYDPGYLPFLIESIGGRFVAFFPGRAVFLDKEHPYLTHLDGLPVEQWLEATRAFIPMGSQQYRIRHGLRHLRYIQHYRALLGRSAKDSIELRLTDHSGGGIRTKSLSVSSRFPIYGTWPDLLNNIKTLNGNIGYMRIPSMSRDAAVSIPRWMDALRSTEGLIIDVRGNGGGSREVLLNLFGYFMRPEDPPHIANVAAYRRFSGFDRDHLKTRFVYRATSNQWSSAEQESIASFAPSFEPQWIPTRGEFSDWHYLVLSPSQSSEVFYYPGPVVMLMDQKCFSATDIFLGAFKGWRNVTLMGTASGGGSACKETFRLPNSDIGVTVASMASFQPSGRLYDTQGIQPDEIVQPEPDYFLMGGRDTVLERAIQRIEKETKGSG